MRTKHKKLSDLRKKVNSSYNAHVSAAGTHREWKRISTGSLMMDINYGISSDGVAGPAVGVIHGFVGWPGASKTTNALKVVAAWQRCCARCHDPAKSVKENQILDDDGAPFLDDNGNPQYMLTGKCDCFSRERWSPGEEPKHKGSAAEKSASKKEYAQWLVDLKENSYEPMVVAYFDVEKTLDMVWARKHGVVVNCIELIQPGYAEQCIDLVDEYIRSGAVDLIVVDSIPAMVPMTEIEVSVEDWQRGLHARLINKAVRKWVGSATQVANTKEDPRIVTQIWIQQWRNTMSQFEPLSMPGGHGQRFAFATLTEFKIKDLEKDEDAGARFGIAKKEGMQTTRAARVCFSTMGKMCKNKTAPDRQGSYRMSFIDDGEMKAGTIFEIEQVFKMGMAIGAISKNEKGGGYKFRGRMYNTQSAIRDVMENKAGVMDWLKREICKAMYKENGP